jgi:hypothetical protein
MLTAAAEAGLKAVLPPGHSILVSVELLRGRVLLVRGDAAGAVVALEGAVKRYEAAPERNNAMLRALGELALARERQGDVAGALATAARAVEAARAATRGFAASEWLGSALLVQATVLRRQGDIAAARAAATEAQRQLAESVGPEAPATRQAEAIVRGSAI